MWMNTYSGASFDPLNPKPEQIKLVDIAHALSNTCRYGGHSLEFYSVAQHSVSVSRLLQEQGYDKQIQLYGLLHDAPEAYYGDIPRPFKKLLPKYTEMEDYLMEVIWSALDIPQPNQLQWEVVMNADNAILAQETETLMNSICEWDLPKSNGRLKNFPLPTTPKDSKAIFAMHYRKLRGI